MKKTFNTIVGGKPLKVEIGEVAKQASGSVMVHYGDSTVLSVAVAEAAETDKPFFPLMVLYQEKLYAAGKIPGGFLRREGRPSEHETLTSRLIDRPLRPLFPEGYYDDVQIINTVLSSDLNASPEMAALFGSSLALIVSDIPFTTPVAGVQVGRIDGKFIINPSHEQMLNSDLDLVVAGTVEAINMVEAGAHEVSEEVILEAMNVAFKEIKTLCKFQEEIAATIGVTKREANLFVASEELYLEVKNAVEEDLIKAVKTVEKLSREEAVNNVKKAYKEKAEEKHFFTEIDGIKVYDSEQKRQYMSQISSVLDDIEREVVRNLIIVDKIRPDGRTPEEIRTLTSRVDLLPRAHGSSLFTRGQTQALGTTTLGSLRENQIIDGLDPTEDEKRFMFHYNFPQYSVGSTGRYGGASRREIGHGALAEKALLQVLPNEESFPYSIRVVSEVLESNGSSSQASICAGSLSLMAAGVPIKAPVAGIAMGLVKSDEGYTILTDILGLEDFYGDMDFKVAGTKEGITAIQMDIKIAGITEEILKEALEQARKGRLQILEHMDTVISEPREQVSKYAPKLISFTIDPEKIKDVIGSGGKNINNIIEQSNNVKIDIEQDGKVFIMHEEYEWVEKAKQLILDIIR